MEKNKNNRLNPVDNAKVRSPTSTQQVDSPPDVNSEPKQHFPGNSSDTATADPLPEVTPVKNTPRSECLVDAPMLLYHNANFYNSICKEKSSSTFPSSEVDVPQVTNPRNLSTTLECLVNPTNELHLPLEIQYKNIQQELPIRKTLNDEQRQELSASPVAKCVKDIANIKNSTLSDDPRREISVPCSNRDGGLFQFDRKRRSAVSYVGDYAESSEEEECVFNERKKIWTRKKRKSEDTENWKPSSSKKRIARNVQKKYEQDQVGTVVARSSNIGCSSGTSNTSDQICHRENPFENDGVVRIANPERENIIPAQQIVVGGEHYMDYIDALDKAPERKGNLGFNAFRIDSLTAFFNGTGTMSRRKKCFNVGPRKRSTNCKKCIICNGLFSAKNGTDNYCARCGGFSLKDKKKSAKIEKKLSKTGSNVHPCENTSSDKVPKKICTQNEETLSTGENKSSAKENNIGKEPFTVIYNVDLESASATQPNKIQTKPNELKSVHVPKAKRPSTVDNNVDLESESAAQPNKILTKPNELKSVHVPKAKRGRPRKTSFEDVIINSEIPPSNDKSDGSNVNKTHHVQKGKESESAVNINDNFTLSITERLRPRINVIRYSKNGISTRNSTQSPKDSNKSKKHSKADVKKKNTNKDVERKPTSSVENNEKKMRRNSEKYQNEKSHPNNFTSNSNCELSNSENTTDRKSKKLDSIKNTSQKISRSYYLDPVVDLSKDSVEIQNYTIQQRITPDDEKSKRKGSLNFVFKKDVRASARHKDSESLNDDVSEKESVFKNSSTKINTGSEGAAKLSTIKIIQNEVNMILESKKKELNVTIKNLPSTERKKLIGTKAIFGTSNSTHEKVETVVSEEPRLEQLNNENSEFNSMQSRSKMTTNENYKNSKGVKNRKRKNTKQLKQRPSNLEDQNDNFKHLHDNSTLQTNKTKGDVPLVRLSKFLPGNSDTAESPDESLLQKKKSKRDVTSEGILKSTPIDNAESPDESSFLQKSQVTQKCFVRCSNERKSAKNQSVDFPSLNKTEIKGPITLEGLKERKSSTKRILRFKNANKHTAKLDFKKILNKKVLVEQLSRPSSHSKFKRNKFMPSKLKSRYKLRTQFESEIRNRRRILSKQCMKSSSSCILKDGETNILRNVKSSKKKVVVKKSSTFNLSTSFLVSNNPKLSTNYYFNLCKNKYRMKYNAKQKNGTYGLSKVSPSYISKNVKPTSISFSESSNDVSTIEQKKTNIGKQVGMFRNSSSASDTFPNTTKAQPITRNSNDSNEVHVNGSTLQTSQPAVKLVNRRDRRVGKGFMPSKATRIVHNSKRRNAQTAFKNKTLNIVTQKKSNSGNRVDLFRNTSSANGHPNPTITQPGNGKSDHSNAVHLNGRTLETSQRTPNSRYFPYTTSHKTRNKLGRLNMNSKGTQTIPLPHILDFETPENTSLPSIPGPSSSQGSNSTTAIPNTCASCAGRQIRGKLSTCEKHNASDPSRKSEDKEYSNVDLNDKLKLLEDIHKTMHSMKEDKINAEKRMTSAYNFMKDIWKKSQISWEVLNAILNAQKTTSSDNSMNGNTSSNDNPGPSCSRSNDHPQPTRSQEGESHFDIIHTVKSEENSSTVQIVDQDDDCLVTYCELNKYSHSTIRTRTKLRTSDAFPTDVNSSSGNEQQKGTDGSSLNSGKEIQEVERAVPTSAGTLNSVQTRNNRMENLFSSLPPNCSSQMPPPHVSRMSNNVNAENNGTGNTLPLPTSNVPRSSTFQPTILSYSMTRRVQDEHTSATVSTNQLPKEQSKPRNPSEEFAVGLGNPNQQLVNTSNVLNEQLVAVQRHTNQPSYNLPVINTVDTSQMQNDNASITHPDTYRQTTAVSAHQSSMSIRNANQAYINRLVPRFPGTHGEFFPGGNAHLMTGYPNNGNQQLNTAINRHREVVQENFNRGSNNPHAAAVGEANKLLVNFPNAFPGLRPSLFNVASHCPPGYIPHQSISTTGNVPAYGIPSANHRTSVEDNNHRRNGGAGNVIGTSLEESVPLNLRMAPVGSIPNRETPFRNSIEMNRLAVCARYSQSSGTPQESIGPPNQRVAMDGNNPGREKQFSDGYHLVRKAAMAGSVTNNGIPIVDHMPFSQRRQSEVPRNQLIPGSRRIVAPGIDTHREIPTSRNVPNYQGRTSNWRQSAGQSSSMAVSHRVPNSYNPAYTQNQMGPLNMTCPASSLERDQT